MISVLHARQFSFAFLSLLAKTGTPILILLVSANKLDIDVFASVAFGLLLYNLVQVVLDLGYQVRLPKVMAIGHDDFKKWFGITLGLKLIVSVLLLGVAAAIMWIAIGRHDALVAVVFLGAGVFSAVAQHFLYVLRGSFEFSREALTLVGTELFVLFSVFTICGAEQWTASCVAIGFVVGKGVQVAVAVAVVRPRVSPVNLAIDSAELKSALPYSVQMIVGAGFLLVDGLIVRGFVSGAEFGLHQMFVRFIVIGCFILGPVQLLLVSYFSRTMATEPKRLRYHAWTVAGSLAVLATAFLAAYWYYSEAILEVLLGESFLSLTQYTWILVAIILLRYICVPFGVFLSVSGNQVERARILGMAFLFLILLNVVLVPSFGVLGAFCASLIAHFVLLTAYIAMGLRIDA